MAIIKPHVRNPYNYDVNEVSDDTGLKCLDPSLARQEFAEESDINFIADKYGLTGELPQIDGAMWGQDFVGIFDFQAAQNQVIEAKRQFLQLPAKLRSRFNNDPAQLLAFLEDNDNRAEAEMLGLVKKQQPAAPDGLQSAPARQPAPKEGDNPAPSQTATGAASSPDKPAT